MIYADTMARFLKLPHSLYLFLTRSSYSSNDDAD